MSLDCNVPVNVNVCTPAELKELAQTVSDLKDFVCNLQPGGESCWVCDTSTVSGSTDKKVGMFAVTDVSITGRNATIQASQNATINTSVRSNNFIAAAYYVKIEGSDTAVNAIVASQGFEQSGTVNNWFISGSGNFIGSSFNASLVGSGDYNISGNYNFIGSSSLALGGVSTNYNTIFGVDAGYVNSLNIDGLQATLIGVKLSAGFTFTSTRGTVIGSELQTGASIGNGSGVYSSVFGGSLLFNSAVIASVNCDLPGARYTLACGYRNKFAGSAGNDGNFVYGYDNDGSSAFGRGCIMGGHTNQLIISSTSSHGLATSIIGGYSSQATLQKPGYANGLYSSALCTINIPSTGAVNNAECNVIIGSASSIFDATNSATTFKSNSIIGSIACKINDSLGTADDMQINGIWASENVIIESGNGNTSISTGAIVEDQNNEINISGTFNSARSVVCLNLGSADIVFNLQGNGNALSACEFGANLNVSGNFNFAGGFDTLDIGSGVYVCTIASSNSIFGGSTIAMFGGNVTFTGTRTAVLASTWVTSAPQTYGGSQQSFISTQDPVGNGAFNCSFLASYQCELSQSRQSIVTGFQNKLYGDSGAQNSIVGGHTNDFSGKWLNNSFVHGKSNSGTGSIKIDASAILGATSTAINTNDAVTNIIVAGCANVTIPNEHLQCAFLGLDTFTPATARSESVYLGNPYIPKDLEEAQTDDYQVMVRSTVTDEDGQVKYASPANLAIRRYIQLQVTPEGQDVPVQNGLAFFNIPADFGGKKIVGIEAYVTTAGTTGDLQLSIHNDTQSLIILSSNAYIESGENSSLTAASQPVINPSNNTVNAGDQISVDVFTVSTTPQQGLRIIVTIE